MTGPIRIVLADDHPLIRDGLRARLQAEPDIEVIGEAANGDEAQTRCLELQPDVVVLDLNMPGPPATETIAFFKDHCPQIRVLVLTAYNDDAYVRGLLAAGVAGYVLKDEAPDALVHAVRSVAHGGTWFSQPIVAQLVAPSPMEPGGQQLTHRERQLLDLVAQGLDNIRIANQLHLSEQTVRNYLSRLYGKLGVQSRAEAIVWARDHDATA